MTLNDHAVSKWKYTLDDGDGSWLMADRRSPLHCGFGAQARSASDQLRTKHGSRGQSFRAVYDPSNCGPKKIALGHVRGSMNLCASRSQVMEQSNCNIILRGM